MCRMCGKLPESLAHAVAACSSLAQTNYMDRHNAALNVLFFELLRDLKLANSVPLWYTRVDPKQMYEPTDEALLGVLGIRDNWQNNFRDKG